MTGDRNNGHCLELTAMLFPILPGVGENTLHVCKAVHEFCQPRIKMSSDT